MNADYELAVREHQIEMLYLDGTMVGLIETMVRPDHFWIENIAINVVGDMQDYKNDITQEPGPTRQPGIRNPIQRDPVGSVHA